MPTPRAARMLVAFACSFAPVPCRHGARRWPGALRAAAMAWALAAAAGCSDTRDALEYWNWMHRQALESAHEYLDAGARGDSMALRRISTDSHYAMLREAGALSSRATSYGEMSRTFRLERMEPIPCGVRLGFWYREAGERREGSMELTDVVGGFKVASTLFDIVH